MALLFDMWEMKPAESWDWRAKSFKLSTSLGEIGVLANRL